ncbi:MAG TPA: hypothetical protein VMW36_09515 [Patescibacteria group bacterium]|nr:hypothetical protein [Patescibacteria group bacterium]
MAKWELAICVEDEEDLPSGHKRKKRGDVIGYMPYPHEWGKVEMDGRYLFIIVDGLTAEEITTLCEAHYADGSMMGEKEPPELGTAIAKRRFSIDIDDLENDLPGVDLAKIKDKKVPYQPFKAAGKVLDATAKKLFKDKHDGKMKNKARKKAFES